MRYIDVDAKGIGRTSAQLWTGGEGFFMALPAAFGSVFAIIFALGESIEASLFFLLLLLYPLFFVVTGLLALKNTIKIGGSIGSYELNKCIAEYTRVPKDLKQFARPALRNVYAHAATHSSYGTNCSYCNDRRAAIRELAFQGFAKSNEDLELIHQFIAARAELNA